MDLKSFIESMRNRNISPPVKMARISTLITYTQLTRKEYNDLRGWEVPSDENPEDLGYLIIFDEMGHTTWWPKDKLEGVLTND